MTSYFLFTPDFKLAFSGSYAQCMAFDQLTREKMHEHLKDRSSSSRRKASFYCL